MNEQLSPEPYEEEDRPHNFYQITTNTGETILLNRDTVILKTYLGKKAVLNHLMILLGTDPPTGVRIWEQIPKNNPAYLEIATLAVEHRAEAHLNLRETEEGLQDAFERQDLQDLRSMPVYNPDNPDHSQD